MKKVMKNCLSFIISLLTMFMIFVLTASLFLNKVVLNEQTYVKILESENISGKIKTHIDENLDYLLVSNNIPSGTLSNIISEEEIETTLYDYIYFTVEFMKNRSGEIPPIDMQSYSKSIDKKIDNFIESNEDNISEEFYGNLGDFKSSALNIISSSLQVIDLNKLSQSKTIQMIAKISSIVSGTKFFGAMGLIIVLLTISHCVIWRGRRKSRRFAWMSYPFISSGVIIFLISFSGYISKFYEHIAIGVEYLKNTAIVIIESYLISMSYMGVTLFVAGILFMSIYWRHLFKVHRSSIKQDVKNLA